MEAKVYNQSGKETGTIKLPAVFELPWNHDLVHQVVVSMESNERASVAHTKDRSEVSGGGKKPWKQKGTGRARHGSSRSPIWRHGGVTHGPRAERNYEKKINKKMRIKALFTILSQKLRDGELVFLDNLTLPAQKTREAQIVLDNLAKAGMEKINYKKGKRALIAVPTNDSGLVKSFRNIGAAQVREARELSPAEALTYKYVVLPQASIEILNTRHG